MTVYLYTKGERQPTTTTTTTRPLRFAVPDWGEFRHSHRNHYVIVHEHWHATHKTHLPLSINQQTDTDTGQAGRQGGQRTNEVMMMMMTT